MPSCDDDDDDDDDDEEIALVCLLVLGRVFFLQPDTDNSGDNSQC